jgi:hypothetical protein
MINAPGNRIAAYILFNAKQTSKYAPAETAVAFYDQLECWGQTKQFMEWSLKRSSILPKGSMHPVLPGSVIKGNTIQLAGSRVSMC